MASLAEFLGVKDELLGEVGKKQVMEIPGGLGASTLLSMLSGSKTIDVPMDPSGNPILTQSKGVTTGNVGEQGGVRSFLEVDNGNWRNLGAQALLGILSKK